MARSQTDSSTVDMVTNRRDVPELAVFHTYNGVVESLLAGTVRRP